MSVAVQIKEPEADVRAAMRELGLKARAAARELAIEGLAAIEFPSTKSAIEVSQLRSYVDTLLGTGDG